eukprot:TRINITY_DN2745_c0_g1_i1.p1 TRINITY_DN2745_c0_g1~~TRINITY_DN2745_c0_g1_i1.p1  ORF type:complete len:431 (-),score=148.44 TRINITY_DN2745_c0_g1_i1:391-1683(-)
MLGKRQQYREDFNMMDSRYGNQAMRPRPTGNYQNQHVPPQAHNRHMNQPPQPQPSQPIPGQHNPHGQPPYHPLPVKNQPPMNQNQTPHMSQIPRDSQLNDPMSPSQIGYSGSNNSQMNPQMVQQHPQVGRSQPVRVPHTGYPNQGNQMVMTQSGGGSGGSGGVQSGVPPPPGPKHYGQHQPGPVNMQAGGMQGGGGTGNINGNMGTPLSPRGTPDVYQTSQPQQPNNPQHMRSSSFDMSQGNPGGAPPPSGNIPSQPPNRSVPQGDPNGGANGMVGGPPNNGAPIGTVSGAPNANPNWQMDHNSYYQRSSSSGGRRTSMVSGQGQGGQGGGQGGGGQGGQGGQGGGGGGGGGGYNPNPNQGNYYYAQQPPQHQYSRRGSNPNSANPVYMRNNNDMVIDDMEMSKQGMMVQGGGGMVQHMQPSQSGHDVQM